jgi:subtilisin family serine protease
VAWHEARPPLAAALQVAASAERFSSAILSQEDLMLRLLPVILALGIANASLAQTTLSSEFKAQLRANPTRSTMAIVMLKGRDPFTQELPHASLSHRPVMEALVKRLRQCADPVLAQIHAWNTETNKEQQAGKSPLHQVSKVQELWTINALIVTATGQAILDLAARPDVSLVLPNRERLNLISNRVRSSRPQGPYTYGLKKIGIDKIQSELHQFGEGVLAGHLDTGVDANHADLKDKLVLFKNFMSTGSSDTTSAPLDDHGHGTHTLGTILGGNSSGTAIGVAPKAKFVCGKIFTGSGSTTDAAILAAMNWIADPDGNPATNDAPKLVSNSWGGPKGSEESEKPYWEIVKTWVRLGIFPCFAAGNEGPGESTVGTPGGYPHAFAVGATDESDQAADFSSRGPITWSNVSYIKPEASCPGVAVYSAKPGGGYQTMDGTSMATPHCAGVITLLYGVNPDFTIEQISALLKDTSTDLGNAGTDNTYGAGRVDAYKAVSIAAHGGKVALKVQTEDGQPLAGTIHQAGVPDVNVSASGSVTLLLVAGSYSLTASAFGYETSAPFTANVVQGQTVEHTFALKKAAQGSITVKVTDAASHAQLPAKVRVLNTSVPEVSTDAQGTAILSLPHGTYTLQVSAFAHDPLKIEGVVVDATPRVFLAALNHLPDILLYDHDGGKAYESFYKTALNACSRPFSYWDVKQAGEIDEATLLAYPVVVYFTGDIYSNTVPAGMQASLKKYLESGGRLLLTGQDVGYELKQTEFYKTVLHSKWVKDAAASREVKGSGFTLSIEGGDGAGNQRYPDAIAIEGDTGVTKLFDYGNAADGPAGLFIDSRVVYLPFGFEGISTADHRKAVMDFLVKKLAPSLKEKASRLSALTALAGVTAGDLYRDYLVDCYEKETPAAQAANRGLLRLTPRQ